MIKELVKVFPNLIQQPLAITIQQLGELNAETQVSFPLIVIVGSGKLIESSLHPGLRGVIRIPFIPVSEYSVKEALI